MKSASAILFLVNFALGRRVTKVYVFPGGSAGIQYSIYWSDDFTTPENIFKDDVHQAWNGDKQFRGDAIIVDLGAEQAVTGLEFAGHICCPISAGTTYRAVKRARIHGSLANDGPWTVLVDRTWEDTELERPKETHSIPETRIRFAKLEIVDNFGTTITWEYFRVLTGSKAIMDVNIL